mmetsp:Transcript_15207/g.37811  ORF Transcript_15207/g.37811 Transcript_15207/m.37811 type:complete len:88 (+) Transcript_15207:2759-3022(+)
MCVQHVHVHSLILMLILSRSTSSSCCCSSGVTLSGSARSPVTDTKIHLQEQVSMKICFPFHITYKLTEDPSDMYLSLLRIGGAKFMR